MNLRRLVQGCRAVALAVGLAAPGSLRAQEPTSVIGTVTDAATTRPLFGATVTLNLPGGSRATRTDQTGTFVFSHVPAGTHTLVVRQLGYAPRNETITVAGDARFTIALDRLAALDTVRVRSARQAIYGVVAAAGEFRPLPNSTVEVLGPSAGRVSTDSAGRFFYPVQSAGVYLVRAKASGFVTQSVSVTVEKQSGVEVTLVLDDDGGQPNHQIEGAYFDFQQRLTRRGNASALVPRAELIQREDVSMVSALLATPLFSSKGLRFTSEACVFVDGTPRAGLSLNAIDVRDVEAVEVYSTTSDRSGTLQERWFRQWRCGDTGFPRTNQNRADDVVRWIVIWLKH
ncbi:MAG TPA: carboxypeptidase regulatory-like domain-containing protein [Gemmatimonadaceae bacterium]